jgi:hypothetical protein
VSCQKHQNRTEGPAPETTDDLKLVLPNYQHVMVRPGDSVSQIATSTYGQASATMLDLMKMANPSIRDIDIISVGQELRLPQLDQGLAVLQEPDGQYALLVLSTPLENRAREIGRALRKHGFEVLAYAARGEALAGPLHGVVFAARLSFALAHRDQERPAGLQGSVDLAQHGVDLLTIDMNQHAHGEHEHRLHGRRLFAGSNQLCRRASAEERLARMAQRAGGVGPAPFAASDSIDVSLWVSNCQFSR